MLKEEIQIKIETDKMSVAGYNPAREPIKVSSHCRPAIFTTDCIHQAYLRIRSAPSSSESEANYIQVVNESEVLMVPPPVSPLPDYCATSLT